MNAFIYIQTAWMHRKVAIPFMMKQYISFPWRKLIITHFWISHPKKKFAIYFLWRCFRIYVNLQQFQFLLAPLWEVLILDHTDGMPVPGLDHGPYLCVGFASDVIVILKDGVEIITFIKCITIMTTCKYIKITELSSPIYLMSVKFSLPNKRTLLSMLVAFSPSLGLGSAALALQLLRLGSNISVESRRLGPS